MSITLGKLTDGRKFPIIESFRERDRLPSCGPYAARVDSARTAGCHFGKKCSAWLRQNAAPAKLLFEHVCIAKCHSVTCAELDEESCGLLRKHGQHKNVLPKLRLRQTRILYSVLKH